MINVRVRRGRSTLSMFLCYKQFIYIYIEDGSRCICSVRTHMSRVLCHVSTCDNVSRASAHRCQGWLLHCGYIHINSDHNLGPCTLYLCSRWVQRLKCNYSQTAAGGGCGCGQSQHSAHFRNNNYMQATLTVLTTPYIVITSSASLLTFAYLIIIYSSNHSAFQSV